ncbi:MULTISPECIES: ASCH domain-containing protein [Pantoea]|uniref:ASCH domain-containing protein n=1 Tax=Pantoea TaxID=53335 RepID=UPI000614BACC|nr:MULTISPECIES: ASCH domain-containing protein [Pantoea]TPE14687.1 ASCH domain-containing protein [Pantoea vagans]KAA5974603.1 ASCH domain-containing protein [Pantoea sp. M_6]KAA5978475.1 ASCH domain-containing protein [Pantoea sp. M_8]KAA5989674.1 ASCH domain-containing protein [Pantoea sp. M_5]KAA5990132.1 ASCH domain-containing protein [Pantoea sp. M_10]
MAMTLEQLQEKYPDAMVDAFGDSPELANALSTLIIAGKKVATCGSAASWQDQEKLPQPGGYSIVLNGEQQPVCVIRTTGLFLTRFDRVTPEMAMLEGEGDLSLDYWRQEHQRYFQREGSFHPEMELIFETFQLVEVI